MNIRRFFRKESAQKNRLKEPIFIVGCGHSGTSLLLAILGTHSEINAIPKESELAFCRRPKSLIRKFNQQTLQMEKSRWVEKTPKHIQKIAKLLRLCPNAKIVIILRDGRDVASSIKSRTGDIEYGAKRWVSDNKQGQEFWEHPQVHMLKYESIIVDFENTIAKLLGFLGESNETDLANYHTTPKYYYSDLI